MLLINNNGNGAVLPFPPMLDLPLTKELKGVRFVRTNRKKTYPEYTAVIYTEQNSSIDLDQFADAEEVKPEELSPIKAKINDNPAVEISNLPEEQTITKPTAPTGVETRIYGASDDLIEFDGGYTGEVGYYEGDENEGSLIIVSDGTLLNITYGKGEQAIWAITVLKKGTAYAGFEPCDDEDEDIYSDVVTLKGDIKYAYVATSWEKVQ